MRTVPSLGMKSLSDFTDRHSFLIYSFCFIWAFSAHPDCFGKTNHFFITQKLYFLGSLVCHNVFDSEQAVNRLVGYSVLFAVCFFVTNYPPTMGAGCYCGQARPFLADVPVCFFAYYEGSVICMDRFALVLVSDQPIMIVSADPNRSHCLAG